ncbi:hypothetical protein DLM86_11090 [Paenibacillus flagellatus]|uniref:DUF2207 domain-containing protein n=2 Tax=Paenibacillus flagellatus TaxID=2211139 RepID=A0A2V5KB02_9BACL|nr:hypothetical protein DLM86_11090 [Paenibacillus flagellatus]
MHPLFIVLLALMAIGIIMSLMSNPFELVVAIVIFGGVFVLWKYPPARWRKAPSRKPSSASRTKPREKRKNVPFRVIQGNKRDDDDNPHPYH